jgi:kynureninase
MPTMTAPADRGPLGVGSEGWSREACLELDRRDPLAPLGARFHRPRGAVYLDGNSLGMLAEGVAARVRKVVESEWAEGLVRSWNGAAWIEMPARVGDKIARLIGADQGEVVACDSTTVNLFKLLAAAVLAQRGDAERPLPGAHRSRTVVLTEEGNFPTDLHAAQGLQRLMGDRIEVRRVPRERLLRNMDDGVAVLYLTHVDFRSAEVLDMARLTAAAHRFGALALWDLSHSAGAVPVDLHAAGVDLAVGCGYKYLNGGPGAPAYVFVSRGIQEWLEPVLKGWMGHAAPFDFDPDHLPAPGVLRHLAGTPPILAMAALEAAIDVWLEADLAAVHAKARALTSLFVDLVDARCQGLGFTVGSPRDARRRGAHVVLEHPEGYAVDRALIARGVVTDFRPPGLLRFGFAPLTTRYVDVWDAVDILGEVVRAGEHLRPEHRTRLAVT